MRDLLLPPAVPAIPAEEASRVVRPDLVRDTEARIGREYEDQMMIELYLAAFPIDIDTR